MPTKKKVSAKSAVTVTFGMTGSSPKNLSFRKGVTKGQFRTSRSLAGVKLLVNGVDAPDEYALQSGDVLTAVTGVKGGN